MNPYDDDPKEHLSLRLFRLRGLTEKGSSTIDVASLNHSERLVLARFKISEKMSEVLETAQERLAKYKEKRDTRSRNRLVGTVEGLLKECIPPSDYSATTATYLLTDKLFQELVFEMKSENLWNDDLANDLNRAESSVLRLA